MRHYIFLIFACAVLIGIGFAENVETEDPEAFKQALEQDGFTVQQGGLGYFDFMKLYNSGVLPSAYGNNPATKYLIYLVPPPSGQEVGGNYFRDN
jgi:hypothetical protein